jgi:hypothetical protein
MGGVPSGRPFFFGGSVPSHVQTELQERYRARAGFFWQKVRDSLLAILKDESKRAAFLLELFKFHLREDI